MKLVTGATGFLGSALVRALVSQSVAVRGVSRQRHASVEIPGADYLSADLCVADPQSKIFDSVDTIVHLASTTIPSTSMDDMMFDARSNIEMALRLLEAARIRGIKNFVFASSGGTVYGDPIRLPTREDDPTDPRSSYGIVKLAIEKYVNLYARMHDMRGVVLRISNPYGCSQLSGTAVGVIARLLRHVHEGTHFHLWGDGTIVRDYFHVDDLMHAFMLVLKDRDLPSGVYNVGGGYGTSIDELIMLVKKITGRPLATDCTPARNVDVPKIWLDIEKFRAATGWQPHIDLEDGIRGLWQTLMEGLPQKSSGVMRT